MCERNSLSLKKNFVKSLLSRNFCEKKCEREFLQFSHCDVIKYFLFQMILFEILVVGLDNLRLWVDHLSPWLCTFYIILRSFLFNAIVLILCILTFIKFTFLCVMKRIPELNDECMSRAIIGSVCIWGVVEVYVKFLMFENKPVVNEVCSQCN